MPSQGLKKQLAVRNSLRQEVELEREADERGASRSEYIRSILRARHRIDELEERLGIKTERIGFRIVYQLVSLFFDRDRTRF